MKVPIYGRESSAPEQNAFNLEADPSVLRVLAFGDAGTGSSTQYEIAETMHRVCEKEFCDMAIMLGDNFYR